MGEVAEKPALKAEPKELSDFGKRLNEVFQEQEPGKPEISVRIFSSYHLGHQGMEGLVEELKHADIYIPEVFGYGQKDLTALRDSSDGKVTLKDLKKRFKRGERTEDFLSILEIVYDSNKPIAIIDVPQKHLLIKESQEVSNYNPSLDDEFENVIEYTKIFLKKFADYQNEREEYMLSEIKPKVEEILQSQPLLQNRKTVNVLLSIGSGHDRVEGDYSECSFADEGILRCKRGEKISRELAARIFIEIEFHGLFDDPSIGLRGWVTEDPTKLLRLERKIFSQFSTEDAKKIFDIKRTGGSPIQEFGNMMEAKGLGMPGNIRELDAFLAKPASSRPKSREGRNEY